MSKGQKLAYHVISGTLLLSGDTRVSGRGTTSNADHIKELTELAQVTTGLGLPAYVTVADADDAEATQQAGQNAQTARGAGNTPPPADPPPVFTLPDGVEATRADQILKGLEAGGLTWESANLLSDADIKAKTTGVGDKSIEVIRKVGQANNYPAFKPAE